MMRPGKGPNAETVGLPEMESNAYYSCSPFLDCTLQSGAQG